MFKKLGEITGKTDLLTVRCTMAWLEMQNGIPTLYIMIEDDMEALTSMRDRAEHIKSASPWLRSQLDFWQKNKGSQILVATPEYPLEVITGDVCPILVIEGKRYLVSAFRDIDPVGWIIPGGCPKDLKELLDPAATAARELEEELIIDSSFPVRELPAKGGHASRAVIIYKGGVFTVENVNIVIIPETASVAATFYRQIHVPGSFKNLKLFDEEKLPDGTPLNRLVRLTDENGETVAIFYKGHNILSRGWHLPSDEMRMFIP